MLCLLEADFEKVKKALHSPPSFVCAVLERTIPGVVYADSGGGSTFLIGTASGIFYVIGEETNSSFNSSLLSRSRRNANMTPFDG